MASACVRSMNLNAHRSLENNQNYILIAQPNFNQSISTNSTATTTTTKMATVQKLKNFTTIAPAPVSVKTTNTNSVLGMNGVNIQSSNQSSISNSQQSNRTALIGGSMYNKKKYTYANIPYGTELPPSVARRNARERNRVKQVNNGYANLRQHIPQTIVTALTNGGRGASKKLSKVDTLRMAVEYIRRLQDVLIEEGCSDNGSDGGSLYGSNSSILSTDGEASPQSGNYYHSAESPALLDRHGNHMQQNIMSTNASDGSYLISQVNGGYSNASVSPAPSYSSDVSIGSNNYKMEQHHHQPQHLFKYEPYDPSYNSITDTTPEDEELLDYISSWQEQ